MAETFFIVLFILALLMETRALGMTIMARRAMITTATRSSTRLNPFCFLKNRASFPISLLISQPLLAQIVY